MCFRPCCIPLFLSLCQCRYRPDPFFRLFSVSVSRRSLWHCPRVVESPRFLVPCFLTLSPALESSTEYLILSQHCAATGTVTQRKRDESCVPSSVDVYHEVFQIEALVGLDSGSPRVQHRTPSGRQRCPQRREALSARTRCALYIYTGCHSRHLLTGFLTDLQDNYAQATFNVPCVGCLGLDDPSHDDESLVRPTLGSYNALPYASAYIPSSCL